MRGSSLQRAECIGRATGVRWGLVAVAVASAFLPPLLVTDLGLVLQLLIGSYSPATSLETRLPFPLLNEIVSGERVAAGGPALLFTLVALSWVLALLDAVSLIVLQRLVRRYAGRVARELRRAIHDQTFALGPHDLMGAFRSRPEELFTERTEVVRRRLIAWREAIPRCVLEWVLLLLLASLVNVWLTLLVLLLALYILPTARAWRRRAQAQADAWREKARKISAELVRALSLAPMAIGYALDRPPTERFDETLGRYEEAELRAGTAGELQRPLLLFIVIVAVSFVLLLAGLSAEVTVAGMVLWGTAMFAAWFPALRLYRLREAGGEAERAAADILNYLDRQPAVTQIADARPLGRLARDIRLVNATLANRAGQRLLDGVSLTIPAGRAVAILASDPQTPLAVAGLFVRFYDPAAGQILYDDFDIGRATLESVRQQAMLVTADGPLVPATLSENIVCGKSEYTTAEIGEAVKQAQADEFVLTLPDGLSTFVGGEDSPLEIHQAFRIGLARALLRNPSVIIVQEPDGRLDEASVRRLDLAIRQAAAGRTLVVLPARLHTLRAVDAICLFHEGKLHALGTHADLLQTSELYRHLNYVRFNPFRDTVSG